MLWQLNRIQYPIYNLGPGTRIGIWVQGCTIHCESCVSKTLWSPKGGRSIDIDYLVGQIVDVAESFDGITVSGGEPFDQYEELISFCEMVKVKTTLDIYVFSGYRLDELNQKFPDLRFISTINYLMDGPYLHEKHEDQNVRGSSNQKLYQFKNGQIINKNTFFSSDNWSVAISDSNEIFMAGIPKKDDLDNLMVELENAGIKKTFK